MPSPWAGNVSKCPVVARVGMDTAGIDWCITFRGVVFIVGLYWNKQGAKETNFPTYPSGKRVQVPLWPLYSCSCFLVDPQFSSLVILVNILGNPGATSRDDAIFFGRKFTSSAEEPLGTYSYRTSSRNGQIPFRWLDRKIFFCPISGMEFDNLTISGTGSVRISSQGLFST